MASDWEGKSKGSVFGYRIFVFLIKTFGVKAAYSLLVFVTFYYCIFAPSNTKSIFYYFRNRIGYSWFKSVTYVYKSYFTFGQTIIDKIAISSGLKDSFEYHFDGQEKIREIYALGKGGILISAHVGNFEISEYFFAEFDTEIVVSLLVSNKEHKAIQDYLDKYIRNSTTKFIVLQDDFSHVFEINAALASNEIVCITGDRYLKDAKYMEEQLFGEVAKFPIGPYQLASRLRVPVLFVYVMKGRKKAYHLYARVADVQYRDAQGLLTQYTKSLEWILEKYPKQWFNYFDFWNTKNKQ
ncbi:MAG: putative LPLAT superfamily acyltransferase [Patiriisocius sp.]|jgi:predicted LPLAT superfamily acyltransferase